MTRPYTYSGCGPITVLLGICGASWVAHQFHAAIQSAFSTGLVAIPSLSRRQGRGLFPVDDVPWMFTAPYLAWLLLVMISCMALAMPRVRLLGTAHPFLTLLGALLISPFPPMFSHDAVTSVAFFVILAALAAAVAVSSWMRARRR